jgi:hypothetical protein
MASLPSSQWPDRCSAEEISVGRVSRRMRWLQLACPEEARYDNLVQRCKKDAMPMPLLTPKPYFPPARQERVSHPRPTWFLDQGLHARHRPTLLGSPAGFKSAAPTDWTDQHRAAFLWMNEQGAEAPSRGE